MNKLQFCRVKMFSVALLSVAGTLIYIWLKWNFTYWKRNKVPGPRPSLIFGNLKSTLSMSVNPGLIALNWYNDFPDEPYIGYYKLFSPAILLRSVDLIKDMMTTNFDCFRYNDINISIRYDPLFAANLITKRDDEWKEKRKAITPMFSPNKMKALVPMMDRVAADFIKFIKLHPDRSDLNAKDIAIRYTTQSILKSLFSIEPGCFDKIEDDNEFLSVPKIIRPCFLTALKGIAIVFWPDLVTKCIPVPLVPRAIDIWFRNFVRSHMKSRCDGSSELNDWVEMLRHIQQKKNYDDSFLEGTSFAFFLDGSESSAVLMSHALYELARNPHCQEKAYEEVARIVSEHDGRLTYEAVMEMNYLDSVLLEASRLHPPNLFLVKLCTKRYTLPTTTKQTKPIDIEPGTSVLIPIFAVHMDPKNYPEPGVFKPERFVNNHTSTLLSFGVGSRACIGMRFAMFQMKVALVHILLNFRIRPSPLQKPLVVDAKSVFVTYTIDGVVVCLETR